MLRMRKFFTACALVGVSTVLLFTSWEKLGTLHGSAILGRITKSHHRGKYLNIATSSIATNQPNVGQGRARAGWPPAVTLFLRMSGKLANHRRLYLCEVFRTMVLYWPSSYGKIVLVLDDDAQEDHAFGESLLTHAKTQFPEYKLEVLYEPLPKDPRVLNFPGMPKPPGYNRQLWSSFLIDFYTKDSVIAWMDSDVSFVLPVTQSSIFNGKKVRLIGSECPMKFSWVKTWARTTEDALGVPFVVDFMVYFPVYIYRDTVRNTREHILKRFKTNNLEEAFMKLYKAYISPVSILLSYAWYFERDRYEWNIKMCSYREEYNKRFSPGHQIPEEFTKDVLPEPQTADHTKYHEPGRPPLYHSVLANYCLTLNATGKAPDKKCRNKTFSPEENLILFNHDLQRVESLQQTPCVGSHRNACLLKLQRRFEEVGDEVLRNKRRMSWQDVEAVERIAKQVTGVTCPEIV